MFKNINEKRFVDRDTSVEDYVESLENMNTKEKTKRDVKLLERKERGAQTMEPAELNKHLADFIRSVRQEFKSQYVYNKHNTTWKVLCTVSSKQAISCCFDLQIHTFGSADWHKK